MLDRPPLVPVLVMPAVRHLREASDREKSRPGRRSPLCSPSCPSDPPSLVRRRWLPPLPPRPTPTTQRDFRRPIPTQPAMPFVGTCPISSRRRIRRHAQPPSGRSMPERRLRRRHSKVPIPLRFYPGPPRRTAFPRHRLLLVPPSLAKRRLPLVPWRTDPSMSRSRHKNSRRGSRRQVPTWEIA